MQYYLSDWFKTGYQSYKVMSEIITRLKQNFLFCKVDIVIDTNCPDVQFLFPRLLKVLDLCEMKELKIHFVDRRILPAQVDGINIEKVPTIVINKEGKEIFRITEKVEVSIEDEFEKGFNRLK